MSIRSKKMLLIVSFVFSIVVVSTYLFGFFALVSLIFELANSVSSDFIPDIFFSCVASFIWGLLYPSVRNMVADVIHFVKFYKKSSVVPEVHNGTSD